MHAWGSPGFQRLLSNVCPNSWRHKRAYKRAPKHIKQNQTCSMYWEGMTQQNCVWHDLRWIRYYIIFLFCGLILYVCIEQCQRMKLSWDLCTDLLWSIEYHQYDWWFQHITSENKGNVHNCKNDLYSRNRGMGQAGQAWNCWWGENKRPVFVPKPFGC